MEPFAYSSLLDIVLLSLRVSGTAVLLSAGLGIPVGVWLGMSRSPLSRALLPAVHTGTALPPVVVGLALYILLSRDGPLAPFNWPSAAFPSEQRWRSTSQFCGCGAGEPSHESPSLRTPERRAQVRGLVSTAHTHAGNPVGADVLHPRAHGRGEKHVAPPPGRPGITDGRTDLVPRGGTVIRCARVTDAPSAPDHDGVSAPPFAEDNCPRQRGLRSANPAPEPRVG